LFTFCRYPHVDLIIGRRLKYRPEFRGKPVVDKVRGKLTLSDIVIPFFNTLAPYLVRNIDIMQLVFNTA